MEEHFIMMKRNFNIVLIKHIMFLSLNGYENVHVIQKVSFQEAQEGRVGSY
jgi:hypothetical protein